MPEKKVVLIGGGVGASTFTKALKGFPVRLSTIVSTFDDGGSTGAIRRDYRGIALGDLRQCLLANLGLDERLVKTLDYRFGHGHLFGVNAGNLILKAFLAQYRNEREGMLALHRFLGLRNQVIPVSYAYAKLCAKLANGGVLSDQQQISEYLSFFAAPIKSVSLSRRAALAPEARRAILEADFLIFAPGHFFTSILPHLSVEGFGAAWRRSRAEKIWCVNLLAHRGQDSFYSLADYLRWFERALGSHPFDCIVRNAGVPRRVLEKVKDRFEETRVTANDIRLLRKKKIALQSADLVSSRVRAQQPNDTIPRAPLRHDPRKIKAYFEKIFA